MENELEEINIKEETEEIKLEENINLEEFLEGDKFEEIINSSIDKTIILERKFSPVLENLTEKQTVEWRRKEREDEKEDNKLNYSGKLEYLKYEKFPKEFSSNISEDFNTNLEIVGRDSNRDNFGLNICIQEFGIRDRNSLEIENNYFNPERFENKDEGISLKVQKKRYNKV
jgi:hypothetical protein